MKKPFFANFLESQVSEQENQDIKGGINPLLTGKLADSDQTMKYPSDNDEGIHTTKYPWDNDDLRSTAKYPSDNDEGIEDLM